MFNDSVYVASSFCVHMLLFGWFKGRSWKAVTRTDSRALRVRHILSVTHVLVHNSVTFGSVLHTLLKLKNKGNFFYFFLFS